VKPRVSLFELVTVLIVLAVGLGLRAAWPSRMAVEHFDEGVYASDLYTPQTDERYPDQHLYAPPLLPFLCYWATVFGGPHAPVWINVVAGSLTLLVAWGMVRDWFGPSPAIAAMALLAFNEFHIAYSRAVLTDALLCLGMTAGVWAGSRAILHGGRLNIVLAGGLAALAWWTKYNGWLTLAITGAGTAGWLVFRSILPASGGRQPPVDATLKSTPEQPIDPTAGLRRPLDEASPAASVCLLRWLATAFIAFLAWSPWLWRLQQYGGYAAVAKNHAGYFGGLRSWGSDAAWQVAAVAHYAQLTSVLGVMAVFCLAAEFAIRQTDEEIEASPRFTRPTQFRAARWIAAAWFLGLTVGVPLYRPYPRLALPWVVGGIVGLAALAAKLFSTPRRSSSSAATVRPPRGVPWGLIVFAVLNAFLCVSLIGDAPSVCVAWQDRTSFKSVAADVIDRLSLEGLDRDVEGYRCAVYVLAEPGLFYHLAAAQPNSPINHLTQAASDYGMAEPGGHRAPVPAYVLIGPHADVAEANRLVAAGRLEPVAEFSYHPSDLVLLDEMPAWDLKKLPRTPTQSVRLFHVKKN
jgi:hypothetical protein